MFQFSRFASAFAVSALSVGASAQTVIFSDTDPGGAGPTLATGAAFTSVGGEGLLSDLSTKFANVNTGAVAIPAETDRTGPISVSIDYRVPADTGLDDGDLLYLQINFDGVNSGSAGFINAATVADGVVRTLTLSESNFNGGGAANFLTASEAVVQFIIADEGFGPGTNFVSPNPAVFVDNFAFSVTAVPEPASLALLGLGGLAMLGRRRG